MAELSPVWHLLDAGSLLCQIGDLLIPAVFLVSLSSEMLSHHLSSGRLSVLHLCCESLFFCYFAAVPFGGSHTLAIDFVFDEGPPALPPLLHHIYSLFGLRLLSGIT